MTIGGAPARHIHDVTPGPTRGPSRDPSAAAGLTERPPPKTTISGWISGRARDDTALVSGIGGHPPTRFTLPLAGRAREGGFSTPNFSPFSPRPKPALSSPHQPHHPAGRANRLVWLSDGAGMFVIPVGKRKCHQCLWEAQGPESRAPENPIAGGEALSHTH